MTRHLTGLSLTTLGGEKVKRDLKVEYDFINGEFTVHAVYVKSLFSFASPIDIWPILDRRSQIFLEMELLMTTEKKSLFDRVIEAVLPNHSEYERLVKENKELDNKIASINKENEVLKSKGI